MNLPQIVVYDACVLYPAPLRDLLIRLAMPRVFQAHWTVRIQQEWSRNLVAKRPDINQDAIAKTQALMERVLPKACLSGYEQHIMEISLPDADDRHVLAAAIFADAQAIVTCNLKDFPHAVLQKYDIQALHPDVFIMQLSTAVPDFVTRTAQEQHRDLQNPPKTWIQFLEVLCRQGLPQTCAFLEQTGE